MNFDEEVRHGTDRVGVRQGFIALQAISGARASKQWPGNELSASIMHPMG